MKFRQKLSAEIFARKYMINGEESPEEVFQQVAKTVAAAEKSKKLRKFWEEEFSEILREGLFIPGGRILANARPNARLRNYNNCFTIEVEDSISGIYRALTEDAIINAAGGGVGFNISHLRPKGTPTSRQGESSGPISFLQVFDSSAKQIRTGGARRGAHIAVMNVDHPDIEEFITCKHGEQNNMLTQFNISVGITDDFISAVERDLNWNLQFNGKIYKTVKARYLYDLLAKNAYEHNEPGILNLDHVNRFNTGSYAFDIETTNPCGEIPMPNYSLCCLGSLNLTQFVQEPFSLSTNFDWYKFRETIRTAIRFLDNVLDVTDYPLEKIQVLSKQWRRIGLGFTGLGDMFAMLRIPYGSAESKIFSTKLAREFRDTAYAASIDLAKEKGAFPALDKKRYLQGDYIFWLENTELKRKIAKYGIRNIAMLTCAPTGTTSLTLGQNCSSGIEPIFSLQYERKYRTGTGEETSTETVYDYAYLEYLDFCKRHDQPEKLDDEAREWFKTASEISPEDGIDIQAIFQRFIDHSISKTCNLPENYSFEEYKKLWMYAYKAGLKGFTTFNPDGCCFIDHEVSTPKGPISFREMFYREDIDPELSRPGWYPCKPFEVDTSTGVEQCSNLYLRGNTNLISIEIDTGEILKLTPEHKLRVKGEWVLVRDLKIGDQIDDIRKDCESEKTSEQL